MEAMGWKTIMVTSLRGGEGKTLTAINLSLVFAKEYSRTVLLVDSNLKKQDIHAYLGISSEQGLADYLEAGRDLAELIIWPCIEKFTFISGGQPVQDATELMGSPRMKALVPELKARYHDRYIIFDVPALLEGADALAFLPLVDGVIVVTQAGTTSKNDIVKGLSLIPQEKMLGFVLNKWQDSGLKQENNGPRSVMPAIGKAFAFLKKKIASS
jgi:non-specific protein-tyrosine kinase